MNHEPKYDFHQKLYTSDGRCGLVREVHSRPNGCFRYKLCGDTGSFVAGESELYPSLAQGQLHAVELGFRRVITRAKETGLSQDAIQEIFRLVMNSCFGAPNTPNNFVQDIIDRVKGKPVAHPIQPLFLDETGRFRFKQNEIVCALLNMHPTLDMNKLALMSFEVEDRQQFAQLLGYSLSGYSMLSYVDDEAYEAAERMITPTKD